MTKQEVIEKLTAHFSNLPTRKERRFAVKMAFKAVKQRFKGKISG